MSLTPAIIDAMVASGCSADEFVAAYKVATDEEREKKARRVPWLKLRKLAFDRDGERCTYCADEVGPFEVDHVVPRIKGGENILENVVVACRRCNRSKKDRERPSS
jgi:5-methylcytosine-specific restriction endonuclease McrA